MKLIVGLGNPGPEYAFTPHNAGFLAVDRIAEVCGVKIANRRGRALTVRARLAGHDVLLAKPQTFMNLSGLAVAALLQELELGVEDLMVLYDELAIPLGYVRIRERGAELSRAGGHNGVKSISGVLGTEEWLRIRIGIGKPPLFSLDGRDPDGSRGREVKAGGTDYLLAPMRKAELAVLDEVLDQAVSAVETVLTKGAGAAMNGFNKKVGSE